MSKVKRKHIGYKFLTKSGLAVVTEVLSKTITFKFYETGNHKTVSSSYFRSRNFLGMVDPEGMKYDNPGAYYPDFRHDANQETYVYRGHTGKPKHEQ